MRRKTKAKREIFHDAIYRHRFFPVRACAARYSKMGFRNYAHVLIHLSGTKSANSRQSTRFHRARNPPSPAHGLRRNLDHGRIAGRPRGRFLTLGSDHGKDTPDEPSGNRRGCAAGIRPHRTRLGVSWRFTVDGMVDSPGMMRIGKQSSER